jgi:hypothetical protein
MPRRAVTTSAIALILNGFVANPAEADAELRFGAGAIQSHHPSFFYDDDDSVLGTSLSAGLAFGTGPLRIALELGADLTASLETEAFHHERWLRSTVGLDVGTGWLSVGVTRGTADTEFGSRSTVGGVTTGGVIVADGPRLRVGVGVEARAGVHNISDDGDDYAFTYSLGLGVTFWYRLGATSSGSRASRAAP